MISKHATYGFLGKHHTEETKRKMALSKIGEKNPMFGKYPTNAFKKGHEVSEEHKRKLSLLHKGKKMSLEHRNKMSAGRKGIKFSEQHRNNLRTAHLGKKLSEKTKRKIGRPMDKHHNWKGGKSFEPYGVEFNKSLKDRIRKKYNYRCQQCFRHEDELFTKKGKKTKLRIHHIDFDKNNNTEPNLIPLCNSCHIQTNYNRADWTQYFQGRIIS